MVVFYGNEDYAEYRSEEYRWIEDLADLPEEFDLLILFIQPTAQELERLSGIGMEKMVAYRGIRIDCRTFHDREELYRMIEQSKEEKKKKEIQNYVDLLEIRTEEEMEYLEDTYKIKFRYPVRYEEQIPLREHPGRLITYRGNAADFKQMVLQIKKHAKNKKILLIDGDLMKPSFDEIFKITKLTTDERSYMTGKDNTGLNIALELIKRKFPIDDILSGTVIKSRFRLTPLRTRVDLLPGNYNIYNYEHYQLQTLQMLVSGVLQRYDWVILKLGDSLFDEFSMSMTHMADYNIFAVPHTKSEIRYYSQLYEVLVGRQDISRSKIGVFQCHPLFGGIFRELFKFSYRGSPAKIHSVIGRL